MSTTTIRATPDVTAVVPAWDLGDVLGCALRSLRRQACVRRVVVVDNASNDPVDASDADVIRLPGRVSVGAARNAGLASVDTKYVCFMDGDDVLHDGALDRLVEVLEARPNAVAAAGAIELWYPAEQLQTPSFYPPQVAWRLQRRPRLFAALNTIMNLFPPVGGAVIRTDAARRAGGFPDLDYLETWCLGVALALLGPIILDARPAKLYRVDPRRDSLKAAGVGRAGTEWRGRAEIRAVVRRLRTGRCLALVTSCLLAVHAAQVLMALRRTEPRQLTMPARSRGSRSP